MNRDTQFSPCRCYRYTLWRDWSDLLSGDKGYLMVIGLNPSTADETQDDPTIRRCIGFARAWGYMALCMTNLFGFRATDPRKMKLADDPAGPENDRFLSECAEGAGLILAAWGCTGRHLDRAEAVMTNVGRAMHCLGRNADGSPKHPLYVAGDVRPVWYPGILK